MRLEWKAHVVERLVRRVLRLEQERDKVDRELERIQWKESMEQTYKKMKEENAVLREAQIKAKGLPSDDRAIYHQRYETPDKDDTTPEDAVHFPCGHAIRKARKTL